MNNNVKFISKLLDEFLSSCNLKKDVIIERPNNKQFGHFSTNLALLLKKDLKDNPCNIANEIIEFINKKQLKCFSKIECVKPGFINFSFKSDFLIKTIEEVLSLKENYGKGKKKNYKFSLEIVSANPTGELHIGHARNGAIGDTIARVMKFCGYDVIAEYYTNDAGVQVNILVTTVFINYLNLLGINKEIPDECYKGDIYKDLAQLFVDEFKDKFKNLNVNNFIIEDSKVHKIFRDKSLNFFMDRIKLTLKELRINIDYYISEQEAYDLKLIDNLLKKYEKTNSTYEKDGALWLKTEKHGDQKDRVLRKSDGTYTYLTPDIASHCSKYDRGKPDKIIDFWGGDHHGYITRLKIGVKVAGYNKDDLIEIQTIQMVRIIQDGKELKMSKRKGTALWIKDIVETVGVNYVRFMLTSKSQDTHMDFDINLFNDKTSKNPLFYIQHALFRSENIVEQANSDEKFGTTKTFNLLNSEQENELLLEMDLFQDYLVSTVKHRKPNILCEYVQNLARLFHAYYNDYKVLDYKNINLSNQRIMFVKSFNQVLTNAITLIGIEFKK
ncbi:arginine--tRNA ligase [Spiroplasma endosymbiont of Amphibalanus improvisus]|uniref:arginine--tRNA ligase n=1 Tax=Spiroplasma endosymbiont of Amphibalanus improvisus TaxID=3066327 RepID=UPI00313D5248